MTVKYILVPKESKTKVITHPTLGCHSQSTLSQICNFKRNSRCAYEVRNWLVNFAQSVYMEYEKYEKDNVTTR